MKTIAALFLFAHLNASAQEQERTLFIYNVAFGAITSGIGAAINKQKQINWKKAFIKGLWQGSIGGLLNYSGKKTLYLINKNQNTIYGWPAKLLHAAGYSIIENAALDEPFLQNWNVDYGPARFDFSFNKKRSFRVRLLPEAIVATILAGIYGKFELGSTLSTGNLIFSRQYPFTSNNNTAFGITFGRSSVYVEKVQYGFNKYRIISHELVHQFQYGEHEIFNTWLKPWASKIKSKSLRKIFSKDVYFDFPYFILPYSISGYHRSPHFYRNFYEFEADRFATNEFVPR